MRKAIDTYIAGIISDNKFAILTGGYESVADYIITNADNADNIESGYCEFFDSGEYADGLTSEQVEEFKSYLIGKYDYLPVDDMNDLCDYINYHDDWLPNVEEIIREKGWISDCGKVFGICHDKFTKAVFTEDGIAGVFTL